MEASDVNLNATEDKEKSSRFCRPMMRHNWSVGKLACESVAIVLPRQRRS